MGGTSPYTYNGVKYIQNKKRFIQMIRCNLQKSYLNFKKYVSLINMHYIFLYIGKIFYFLESKLHLMIQYIRWSASKSITLRQVHVDMSFVVQVFVDFDIFATVAFIKASETLAFGFVFCLCQKLFWSKLLLRMVQFHG